MPEHIDSFLTILTILGIGWKLSASFQDRMNSIDIHFRELTGTLRNHEARLRQLEDKKKEKETI